MPIVQKTGATKVKGVADVVFVFDCTASMSPYLDAMKKNVAALVKGFNATPQVKLEWRVRAMGFRDMTCDEESMIDGFRFTDDVDTFVNKQLSAITLSGGGDYEESALDAIWYALKRTNWRSPCQKAIVLFTDAGTKPVHTQTQKKLGVLPELDYLIQELMKERIILFIYGPHDPAFEQLGRMEKANVNLYDDVKDILAETAFSDLLTAIGKTVSGSVNGGGRTL